MKLFCWREHQIHPYYKFGPLKVDLLSLHPKTEVVMVHNVVSPRLLALLKNSDRTYTIRPNEGMTSRDCLYLPMSHVESVGCRLDKLNSPNYFIYFSFRYATKHFPRFSQVLEYSAQRSWQEQVELKYEGCGENTADSPLG